ncbi:MAG: inositol monophosphatase family protein, partial [Chlamydiota bacterium]
EQLLQREITPSVVQELFPNIDGCGLRICSIAEGVRNLYISKGIRGGLWDYCSGEVILREAGGFISDLEGNEIDYRTPDGLLSHGALVTNDKALHDKVVQIQRELAHN